MGPAKTGRHKKSSAQLCMRVVIWRIYAQLEGTAVADSAQSQFCMSQDVQVRGDWVPIIMTAHQVGTQL